MTPNPRNHATTEANISDVFNIQSLKDYSDGDLAMHLDNMADLLDRHIAFQDPNRSPCVPGGGDLREHSAEIKVTSIAAKHDPTKGPARDAARERALRTVTFCCQHAVMFATHVNDPSHLDTIGMERAKKPVRNTKATLKQFEKFLVTHLPGESGAVKIHVNTWDGKGSVQVQICYGDPSREESWSTVKVGHSCIFSIHGLEPAKRAFFRGRLQNNEGVSPWSEVVALIIL